MTTEQSARERAQETAGTAADEGKHVAGTAKEEVQRVASEATTQARSVMNDALGQVTEQSATQKDRLASTLRTLGDDLDSMAGQGAPGLASDLARQVSGHARTLGSHLEIRDPRELLDDVRRFARRRPGTFLLGALAAGVVVGRLARGTADGIAAAEATGPTSGTPAPAPPIPPSPVEPTLEPPYSMDPSVPQGRPVTDPPQVPATPPMSTPVAGYGERGVGGDGAPR
ncbi:MAG TPA: hypothetical protein VMF51_03905 [Nocardioides sp.]|uniref:hypothetical protein n=1 Tax=Nocardioides sp. TaxID=35761 RepID=UPI002CDBE3CB|nr:hypothetical protein [Nocardioides sp.]HTW14248.1 hypothetical protein [Nocardioides sp.]